MRKFLFGMLAGVCLAAIASMFGFYGINETWKYEIWRRGGGVYLSNFKTGKSHWEWRVQPIE